MSRLIVLAGIVGMIALVAAAFCWDCVRLESGYRRFAARADEQVAKHEQRLIAAVEGWPNLPADVVAALAAYRAAADSAERREAFAALAIATDKSLLATLDATNPAARRVIDEVHGAINRRNVVLKEIGGSLEEHARWSESFRSSVARMFLGPAVVLPSA
ncbi:MAG: hypothetical protein K1X74_07395 [Pirellulales bacterium]|nr:hypothetical protein [Pirellulales bacterium]